MTKPRRDRVTVAVVTADHSEIALAHGTCIPGAVENAYFLPGGGVGDKGIAATVQKECAEELGQQVRFHALLHGVLPFTVDFPSIPRKKMTATQRERRANYSGTRSIGCVGVCTGWRTDGTMLMAEDAAEFSESMSFGRAVSVLQDEMARFPNHEDMFRHMIEVVRAAETLMVR